VSGATSIPAPASGSSRRWVEGNYSNLNENENAFLGHITMWGSTGYPVMKVGKVWMWTEAFGIKGPVCYKTKKAAFAAVEAYLLALRDRAAERFPGTTNSMFERF